MLDHDVQKIWTKVKKAVALKATVVGRCKPNRLFCEEKSLLRSPRCYSSR